MLEGFLMSAALVAGQAPVPAVPVPVAPPIQMRVQAVAQPSTPAPMPMKATTPPAAMPAPAGSAAPAAAPAYSYPAPTYSYPADAAPAAEPAAEEPEEEAPTYFLGNLFGSTPVGGWMKEKGIEIWGWTEVSYNASTARNNAPIFMYDQADRWVMNQNFLHVGKTIDTSKPCFQLGGVAELILPGTDARTTISRNLLTSQLDGREYPIDLFQAYGEAYLPGVGPQGTAVKFGKFATVIGYELVQAWDTPFLGRSFLFQYNPFTHSGVLATTPLNDDWTIMNGAVLGADVFFGDVGRFNYLGALKYAPKDGSSTLQFATLLTDPTYDVDDAFTFYNVYNLLFTHAFNDKLSYVVDAMYSHTRGVPGLGFTDWYGAAQYLFYQHNDCFKSGFRVELFEDSEGFRTGTSGLYTSATYGLTYTPTDWLMLRPSIQYAHNPNGPWQGDDDVWIGAMDFIIRW